jgi:ArsR family transcriptional regulator, repressor of sdpIR and other operons
MTQRNAEKELQSVNAVFKALDHPTRRQILMVMHFRGDAMTAGEIAERFSCRWPTVSRHMKVLERASLVRVEKSGRERLYRLERNNLNIARFWFTSFDQ